MRTVVWIAVTVSVWLGLGSIARACDGNSGRRQYSVRGVVEEVSGPELVVRSSGRSQSVLVTDSTVIRSGAAEVSSRSLEPGVAVLIEVRRTGRQVEARTIWLTEEPGAERRQAIPVGTANGGHRH